MAKTTIVNFDFRDRFLSLNFPFFIVVLYQQIQIIMPTNQHIISLNEATTMTHAYQNAQQFQGLTKACLIDNNAYQQLMTQAGCEGVRTYFALNDTGVLTIVVVGVDANGNDMTTGVILNHALDCPQVCPINSPLM